MAGQVCSLTNLLSTFNLTTVVGPCSTILTLEMKERKEDDEKKDKNEGKREKETREAVNKKKGNGQKVKRRREHQKIGIRRTTGRVETTAHYEEEEKERVEEAEKK